MNSPTPPDGAPEAGGPPVSLDAFWRGAFHLVQPAGRGFRAGHDALLLASCVAPEAAGAALDMGAGTGAVGFAAAVRAPALRVDLAERNVEMAALAERSRGLEENRAVAARLRVLRADCLAARSERETAGLRDGAYDLVLTNPPFHPPGRASPDPLRAEALALPDGDFLPRWIAVAAALLRHRGQMAMVARPANLPEILRGAERRLGSLRIRAVHSAAEGPAVRLLVGATAGSRESLRILPPLVLDAALRDAVSAGRHHVAGLLEP